MKTLWTHNKNGQYNEVMGTQLPVPLPLLPAFPGTGWMRSMALLPALDVYFVIG